MNDEDYFDNEYDEYAEFDDYHGGYIEDAAAYKDVFGETARGGVVEREGIYTGTEIAGGALRDIQEHLDRINKDPREQFRIEVEQELGKYEEFGVDKFVLRKYVDNLYFIQYKNANAYILGYVLSQYIPDTLNPKRENELLRVKKSIEKEISTLRINMFEIVKYAIWWKNILSRS